ncbi:MAG: 3-hydroxyacyl-ACP dehydratase FabZ [Candidatus Lambdaproteobacteria bacterium]|nr:3-hydroxyacyl-ACP dehydratase FabZ [Candidatus Lambdaproteobacteria bacterium]
MDLDDIKRRLPHRYPFLLIDRVLEVEEGVSCKALKNVTANEPFFQGHFPDRPIMPGVLIVEAMAQACGIAAFAGETNPAEKLLLFVGIDKARFKRPVVPGDQLVFEVRIVSHKFNIWVFQAKATVDGDLAAQAEIRTATVPKSGKA